MPGGLEGVYAFIWLVSPSFLPGFLDYRLTRLLEVFEFRLRAIAVSTANSYGSQNEARSTPYYWLLSFQAPRRQDISATRLLTSLHRTTHWQRGSAHPEDMPQGEAVFKIDVTIVGGSTYHVYASFPTQENAT